MSSADSNKPHNVKLSVKIAAIPDVSNPLLHDSTRDYWPALRGKLLNWRYETPALGKKANPEAIPAPGAPAGGTPDAALPSWEEWVPSKATREDSASSSSRKPSAGPKDAKTKDKGKEKEAAAPEEIHAKPLDQKLFIFKQEFPEVKADADFAYTLESEPHLHSFLSLVPELRPVVPDELASPKPAAKKPADKDKDKGAVQAAAAAPTLLPIPYAAWLPLDCSPLLVGEQQLSIAFGDLGAALQAVNPTDATGAVAVTDDELRRNLALAVGQLSSTTLPPVGAFRFLQITVHITSCVIEADAPAPAAATTTTTKPSKPLPSKTAQPVEVGARQVIPAALLSAAVASIVKPVTIHIQSAKAIPGISIPPDSDSSVAECVSPDPYYLLRKHCTPPFVLVRLADLLAPGTAKAPAPLLEIVGDDCRIHDETLCRGEIPRIAFTHCASHGPKASWNMTTVICLGQCTPLHLRELLSSRYISVELHDRDVPVWDSLQENGPEPEEKLNGSSKLVENVEAVRPSSPPVLLQQPAASSKVSSSKSSPPTTAKSSPRAKTSEAPAAKSVVAQELSMASVHQAVWPLAPAYPSLPRPRLTLYSGLWNGNTECPFALFHVHQTAENSSSLAQTTARPGSSSKGKNASPRPPTSGGGKTKSETKGPAADSGAQGIQTDVFRHSHEDVDDMFIREHLLRLAAARDRHSFASAQLKLDCLYARDPTSIAAGKNLWEMQLCPTASKRLFIPVTPEPSWALSTEQRYCQQPGGYAQASTTLRCCIATTTSLNFRQAMARGRFERLVVMFPYEDVSTLGTLMNQIAEHNMHSFPHAPSFRTYELSAEERGALEDGSTDAITGLEVIDGNARIFFLESQADGYLATVRRALPRKGLNTTDFVLLSNPRVIFTRRLYTCFNICPKYIRLRYPLSAILNKPSSYDPSVISKELLDALQCFRWLGSSHGMEEMQKQDSFPTPAGLLELENKFGGPVSLSDVYGTGSREAHALETTQHELKELEGTAQNHLGATLNARNLLRTIDLEPRVRHEDGIPSASDDASTKSPNSPTGSFTKRDFLQEHIEHIHEMSHRAAAGKEHVKYFQPLGHAEGPVYMYGGQALNTTAHHMDELRRLLAEDKKAIFTQGLEFASQTIAVIDPADIAKNEAAVSRKRWKTTKGFVYPAPKDANDYAKLDRKPTDARIQELQESWVDAVERSALEAAEEKLRATLLGQAPFQSMPDPHALKDGVFGYVDRQNNPVAREEFFKSVHLPPGGVEAELEAKKAAEKAAWKDKVVVDNTSLRPFHSPDAARSERYKPMLRGEPHKRTFKLLQSGFHNATQKIPPMEPLPVSMRLSEPWQDPRDIAYADARATHQLKPFATCTLPPAVKNSHIYSPIRAAGLAASSLPGKRPVVKTHVYGINTDFK